jgi:hypothetical protein
LKDAFGNVTPVTAYGLSISSFVLNPETDLNVRITDRCPIYKSAISGSIATNRSVCGARQYDWNFSQTSPVIALPFSVQGALGGSRIISVSSIPGISQGQKYLVKLRINHFDGFSNSEYGTSQCVQTIGSAGAPIVDDGVITQRDEHGVTTSIYPNPNNGQLVNFMVSGLEGDMNVRISDASGRIVYEEKYSLEGSLNGTIEFERKLSGGMYMVEILQNGVAKTLRMVVVN